MLNERPSHRRTQADKIPPSADMPTPRRTKVRGISAGGSSASVPARKVPVNADSHGSKRSAARNGRCRKRVVAMTSKMNIKAEASAATCRHCCNGSIAEEVKRPTIVRIFCLAPREKNKIIEAFPTLSAAAFASSELCKFQVFLLFSNCSARSPIMGYKVVRRTGKAWVDRFHISRASRACKYAAYQIGRPAKAVGPRISCF